MSAEPGRCAPSLSWEEREQSSPRLRGEPRPAESGEPTPPGVCTLSLTSLPPNCIRSFSPCSRPGNVQAPLSLPNFPERCAFVVLSESPSACPPSSSPSWPPPVTPPGSPVRSPLTSRSLNPSSYGTSGQHWTLLWCCRVPESAWLPALPVSPPSDSHAGSSAFTGLDAHLSRIRMQ